MKNKDMDEFEFCLIKALDGKKVRAKIKEIMEGEEREKKRSGLFGGNDERWREEAEALKIELEKEKREKASIAVLTEQLKQERNELLKQIRENEKRIGDLQTENREWKENVERLKMKTEKLEEKGKEAAKGKEKLEQEKNEIAAECERRIAESKESVRKAEAVSRYYEKVYIRLEHHFRMYIDLGEEIHNDLSRVLSAESPELFLGWGMQWGNIEALWDFISYKLDSYQTIQIETLSKIFDYLFEIYEQIEGNYKRLEVSVGEEFDEDYHTRGSNSAVSGNISQVLLRGYQGVSNRRIKKSIVRI